MSCFCFGACCVSFLIHYSQSWIDLPLGIQVFLRKSDIQEPDVGSGLHNTFKLTIFPKAQM